MSNHKNIVVLGAGESGVGAAILAQKEGFNVFVSELGTIAEEYRAILEEKKIAYEEGKHSIERILEQSNLVIKSPGIPDHVALIQQLKAKAIPVIDELEFASRYTQATIVGITGSNGKTTTTRLLHHILEVAGFDVGIAGNIGFSLAKQVAEKDRAYYVVEVSSFQLDNMTTFNPRIAILLNITPDHLDRYEYQLEKYIASKFRIVQNKEAEQVFIYNSDDANIQYGWTHFYNGNTTGICEVSMRALEQDSELFRVPQIGFEISKGALALKGRHNYFNMQCAVLAAHELGVEQAAIKKALSSFENEPHRLESVITLNEIEFINDSKATNVDAVFYALEAMTKPVVWIAGGVDKGNDYARLLDLVQEKVRAIVCLGMDNTRIQEAFEGKHEIIVEARSVEEAIKIATLYAESGDAVLLSPACASFDLFKNYIDRGNKFKAVLRQQHKIMTEGIQVSLNIDFKQNPVDRKSDD